MTRFLAAALVITTLTTWRAVAEDFPITGKKLVIAQAPSGSQVLVFISRDVIRAPVPGGADDPVTNGTGATLRIISGAQSAVFDLPAANWLVNAFGTVFRYRNPAASPGPLAVKVVRIKNGSLIKISGKGTGIGLPSQGSFDVVLSSGTRRWCASFGGTIVLDTNSRFIAKNAPLGACPAPPPTTSTTSTTTTNTSSSSVTSTTSTTSTSTSSTLAPSCPPPAVSAGNAGFTIVTGTASCGGPGLVPNAAAPTSGAIFDGSDVKMADLGLGCFYAGDGLSNALPASQLVPGTKNYLGLGSVNGLAFTLTASNGTGPLDCSRGAGPDSHCYNGHPGTNGMGLCTVDSDCGSDQDYCLPRANCYFGAPIPLRPSASAFNSCVMQAILTDACGAINLNDATASLSVALGVRMYLTQADPPCPACVGGTCNSGQRMGQACAGGFGPENTSVECPPLDADFIGQLLVNPLSVTSGTAGMVSDAQGNFCPGQRQPGIFGTGFAGRRITQTGTLIPTNDPTSFTVQLGGNLCLGSSGADLVDGIVGLPGPSSASVTGSFEICVLPDVCTTVCNPCTLGPLCDLLCSPCLLCLP